LPRTAGHRVAELVALGGAVAFGGMVALGMAIVEPAAASTTVATSVSFSVNLWADPPAQRTTHFVVQGQMDFVHHTITAAVTVPRTALRPSSSDASAAFLPAGDSMNLHTEWVDGHAYMTVPASWAGLVKGARALSLPTSSSARRTIDTALTQSAAALSYARILLDQLTNHHAVHLAHPRVIGGIPVTGTTADLTLAELLKLVPELSPTMTKNAATMASQTIPTTVWVDHQGRLVEVTMRAAPGDTESVTGTVRFSNYNAPAQLHAPASATVKPLPPALRQLLGSVYLF
jgi:hypothetical protein